MTKILSRATIAILCTLVIAYAVDWTILRVRVSHGTAFGTVTVNQLLATPLKGNKVEYDVVGTVPESCSHSLFPQMGRPACWWLARHATEWE